LGTLGRTTVHPKSANALPLLGHTRPPTRNLDRGSASDDDGGAVSERCPIAENLGRHARRFRYGMSKGREA
jgi:hypothetical protein